MNDVKKTTQQLELKNKQFETQILENNMKIKELNQQLKKEKNHMVSTDKKMKEMDQKQKQDFYAFKTDINTKHDVILKEKVSVIEEHVTQNQDL